MNLRPLAFAKFHTESVAIRPFIAEADSTSGAKCHSDNRTLRRSFNARRAVDLSDCALIIHQKQLTLR